MQKIEMEFFDRYKELDNLCRDILGSETGVSSYINTMDGVYSYAVPKIPRFKDDLKTLKHLRHIRNSIAHDNEDGTAIATESDLCAVKKMKELIMSSEDGYSLYLKSIRIKRKTAPKTPTQTGGYYKTPAKQKLGFGTFLFLAIFAVAIILITISVLTK